MSKHAINARTQLFERMEEASVAILYAGKAPHKSLDQSYGYTPQRNFYYVTNLSEPNMILMMMKGKNKTKTTLFIEKNTDYIIKWEGARMEKEEASNVSGIDPSDIQFTDSFESVFNMAMNYARSPLGAPPTTLYLDLYHVSPQTPPIALEHADFILKNYRELTLKNINEHLSYLRMFKSEEEINHIRTAIEYTRVGLETLMKNLPKRTHEYQLDADFEHAIKYQGSEGCAFNTIAASGENATVLHYIENRSALPSESLILFDLGALSKHYAADISRTYPISGTFTKRQKTLYEIVLTVNKEAINFVKPGITWKELNAFTKTRLIEETKAIGLIQNDEEIGDYYYHTVGHFLGLDVHDVGYYDKPLEAGMVLTIEPGLYVKEENIGIRIEDNILVTDKGSINLSADIIKEVDDIERFMKR